MFPPMRQVGEDDQYDGEYKVIWPRLRSRICAQEGE